jgi:hypothetical protein
MRLLKQVRDEGYGVGILCPDAKSAAWAIETIVEVLTGDAREARVTGLMVIHGQRGHLQPYLFAQDADDGILVAEVGLYWTEKLKDVLQWLYVGAMDEDILPPTWAVEEDKKEVLDRDYENEVREDLDIYEESESFFGGFESLDHMMEEMEEEYERVDW